MSDASAGIGSDELCLLWKGNQYLRGKFLYLKQSSIGCKKFQIVLPEPYLTNFRFLSNFSIGKTLPSHDRSFPQNWLKWTVPPLKGSPISERESCFTLSGLVLAAKGSKECTQNHFWQIFSFLRNFSIGQDFTSDDQLPHIL